MDTINAKDSIYSELITTARHHGTLTYTDIVDIMGLPHTRHNLCNLAGYLVGTISEDEYAEGRPMLSAIVVSVKDRTPGKGFFGLAIKVGLLPEGATKEAKYEFWKNELEKVYKTWRFIAKSS